MASVLRMPRVLADANEAAIASWLVAPGDRVAAGDAIAEIETEKALVEYQAEESGIVGRLVLAAGEAGRVGAAMAVLISDGETEADIDAALGDHVGDGTAAPSERGRSGSRVFASPLVRKVAQQQGINLGDVAGTGPNGRIVRRDLARLQQRTAATPPPPAPAPTPAPTPAPVPAPGPVAVAGNAGSTADGPAAGDTLIPHTPARRAIARRLTESKASTPHFYLAAECVVDELLALRARINATAAEKVSVNDFVLMAAAAAFADVPEANVTWTDEGLLALGSVDVAIAVATEGGLVTPVLRGLQGRRLSSIASEARALAGRARDRRLRQHELEGGTFAVSNLGMYGTLEFSAIINPPQSGILAVGAARPQPVVVDGAVTVATVIRCTLSVDHRAIDGALAARWLSAFTARMQDPLGMIV